MLKKSNWLVFITLSFVFLANIIIAQSTSKTDSLKNNRGYPVILDSDTLFNIYSGIGSFSSAKRADEISIILGKIVKDESLNFSSMKIEHANGLLVLSLSNNTIMAVTEADAKPEGIQTDSLANRYKKILISKLTLTAEKYSKKSLIENGLYSVLFVVLLVGFFWISRKLFPWLYKKILSLEGNIIKSASIKGKEVVKSSSLVSFIVVVVQGIRFAISLFLIYLFIVETLHIWPYTRNWDIEPILKGIVLVIFYSVVLISLSKGVNALIKFLMGRYESWKGTLIKSIKIKSVELLSAQRTVEILDFVTKIFRFALFIIIFYSYLTIIFSLFEFSSSWAEKLLNYILMPLNSVFTSLVNFLPNLFFIIVLVTVFHYLIRFVKFLFGEVEKKNLVFPGFHEEWAMPTYKIARFLILILAAIIIFPYLPGSNSPFFQGISVFIGILFSLGSSSAISNIVAGVVLTYMRPFKIGDRVKIADTMGDVIEKTMLVTRLRTIKNVDVTIPNSMIMGSHIINYSSSSSDAGLILHTTVTIGYDAPWKQVHELLIAAANETDNIKTEPKPFVLQTSLDDFYVSYQINAYTDSPGIMAKTYSQLHSKIQDKFNEAGVEIMSSHYSSVRDGNQTTIPENYLPKEYKAPSFRLFGVDLFGNNTPNQSK